MVTKLPWVTEIFLRARGDLESHERLGARKTYGSEGLDLPFPMNIDPIFALFTLDQSHRMNHA